MKALILAAGLGTRLAPITNDRPKSLVTINGKPILIKQIENLHTNGIMDITIISGYKTEVLEDIIHSMYPEINIIYSADYATTNNMYSAWLGRTAINNEEFIMMNADVFFDESVIRELLAFSAANAIVTDVGNYLEESMKVVEKNGRLIRISKDITCEEALGVSIDVYKFSALGAKSFFNKCTEYIEDKKELNLWSEVALNDVLLDIIFEACPLVGRWVEIDNYDDLAIAESLFGE